MSHKTSKVLIASVIILLTAFSFTFAQSCSLKTTGLSKTNYQGKEGEVLMLQMILARDTNIYPEGIMSGIFGNLTEKALKNLQKENNLTQSGTLDEQTLEILCNYYYECPFQTLLIDNGSSEPVYEIKALQSLLSFLGYYTYPSITGYFGSVTEKSLIAYQKANNLYPTGLIDYDTQAKLCATFNNLPNLKPVKAVTPTSSLKVSCYASPNPAKVNEPITFYSSVSSGTPPYTYY